MKKQIGTCLGIVGLFAVGAAGCGIETLPVDGDDAASSALEASRSIPMAKQQSPMLAPRIVFPLINDNGGPVLPHPHIITITFAGYPFEAGVQAFGHWIATSDWLAATGSEYGVGTGSHVVDVVLPGPAPATMTDSQIKAVLKARIHDGTLPNPADIEDPVYMFYFPHETEVTFGGTTCSTDNTVGGYHFEATYGGNKFAYAVMPTCAADPATALKYVEESAGHELIEAATDPFFQTDPAWYTDDNQNPWIATFIGETADFCELMAANTYGNFTVPRVWSNAAALAGTDPCIPAPAEPYQNVSVSPGGIPKVAPGDSVTFELTGWSMESVPAWDIGVLRTFGDFEPEVVIAQSTIEVGEKVSMTVTVPAGAPSHGQSTAIIYSARDLANGRYTYWPIVVRTR